VRSFLYSLGFAWAAVSPLGAQVSSLDSSLHRHVADYTRLYTRDSLPKWRELFLPTFTSASTRADSGVSVRRLDEFYAAQERGFATATRMGERLENVRIERRGRMATVWADFVYWSDDDGRRGRLVLTAIFQREGWRFHSLMFSHYD
jgi:hypothetical protein